MKLVTIASGSSGNCIYIGSENRNFIIDAGISLRRIENGLAGLGLGVGDLDGIFITHEHADHISGLGVLLRKYPLPVYLSEGTYQAVTEGRMLGSVPAEVFRPFRTGAAFGFGDVSVRTISVMHDAADPVVYRFESGGSACAVVTDLGSYDDALTDWLQGLSAIVIEANHDLRMLQTGPYPYPLKHRISGEMGHLSNEAAGRLLSSIMCPSLGAVVLGHLSKMNNYPELAWQAVHMELAFLEENGIRLIVAPPAENSETVEF